MRKPQGATRPMRRKSNRGDRGGGDGNKNGVGLQERSIREEVVTVTKGTSGEPRTECFVSNSVGNFFLCLLVNISVLPQ